MARPTILLVEDRSDIRDELAREFHDAGARVLATASAADALKMFQRRAFEIAALVTDVRLEDETDEDISGVSLAKQISEVSPTLPRYGVTAYDSSVGVGVLDEVYSKTIKSSLAPMSIYQNITKIVDFASRYDEARFRDIPGDLLAIKNKYRISGADFTLLVSSWRIADLGRLALLTWHDVQDKGVSDEDESRPEDQARRIQFIPAGTEIGDATLRVDLAVVVREVEGGFIVELYGMPLIYAYADTNEEAVWALVEHLYDCYGNMGKPDEFSGPNILDVVRFRAFLDQLFVPIKVS